MGRARASLMLSRIFWAIRQAELGLIDALWNLPESSDKEERVGGSIDKSTKQEAL
jgi:hypothetical protein